ncbi:hypothetical protein ACFE04_001206 [Oxalis oulophora]
MPETEQKLNGPSPQLKLNGDDDGDGVNGVRNSCLLGSTASNLRSSDDQCGEKDDSKLLRADVDVPVNGGGVDAADVAATIIKDAVSDSVADSVVVAANNAAAMESNTGKRKRGRPPRNQSVARQAAQQHSRKVKEDEDVCFICFDGGSLVLCDHRGCPKAYHPACIKRDEAFFMSTAKWDCGWHLCNTCQRASYYMCYTCTYSLCKGCTRGADFSTVRGSKGFCGTCMKTIMLIENGAQANGEVVQVDFDDKTSWEYLFKVYWVCLKEKLGLTLHELTRAKTPFKETAVLTSRIDSRVELRNRNDEKGCSSDTFRANMETDLTYVKAIDSPKDLNKAHCPDIETSGNDSVIPLPEGVKWATNELLEFVAYMKNGDTSMISNIDLQALLLEYIKRYNLQDPLETSEIICDSRLKGLFGKARVSHIEMLKLLEYHVLTNRTSPSVETIKGEVVNGSIGKQLMMENDRKRKTRRSTDEIAAPAYSPDEYAAINFHNVHLIYLTRNLMEKMIDDDINQFREKTIGSVVRIKISGGDQKQEAYRLVQVVGTNKAFEPYNIGSKTTDVVLEILNFDKKELVPIDELSNQAFSEDECIRLRQSIKCGLNKRLKVGEIKEKAMTLKDIKVNDVLNSPVGRQCKLLENPEIHADPNMDPAYDSDDGAGFGYDKKKDETKRRRRASGAGRKKKAESKAHQNQSSTLEKDENTFYVDKDGIVHAPGSISETMDDEEKIWNYRDPMGNIQGPFPMAQLRKWSMHFPPCFKIWKINQSQDESILLTHALQRKCNNYKDHVNTPVVQLLQPLEIIDEKGKSLNVESCRTDTEIKLAEQNNEFGKSEGSHSSGANSPIENDTSIDNIVNEIIRSVGLSSESSPVTNPSQNDTSIHGDENNNQSSCGTTIDTSTWGDNVNEIIRSVGLGSESSPVTNPTQNDSNSIDNSKLTMGDDGFGSHSSGRTELSHNYTTHGNANDRLASSDNGLSHNVSVGSDSSAEMADSKGQTQNVSVSLGSLPAQTQLKCSIPKFQVGETIQDSTKACDSVEDNNKRPDCNIAADQSPVQNESVQSINIDGSLPVTKSLEILAKNGSIDFLNLGGSTPKPVSQDLRLQDADVKMSLSTDVPPLQNSNPSWSTTASICKVDGGLDGYSSTPAAKHVEEWDLNISHMPPVGMAIDHAATPTSGVDQIMTSSPSCPIPDASSWQAMVTEPAEFLVDDLLAEVEAMESLNGGISSATGMRPPDEDDCFSLLDGFSLARGPGDFFYSQKHSTVRSPSSADAEYNYTKANNGVPINRHEMGSHVQPMVTSSGEVDMATADLLWRLEPQNREAHWASIHSNSNVNPRGGGLSQVSTVADMPWGSTHTQANTPINPSLSMSTTTMSMPDDNKRISSLSMSTTTMSTPYDNTRILNNQPRYAAGDHNRLSGQKDHDFVDNRSSGQRDYDSGDNRLSGQRDYGSGDNRLSGQRDYDSGDNRLSGQRDRDFYGRDSDFSRGNRSSPWSNHRQQSTINGGGQYRADRQQQPHGGIAASGGGGYNYRQHPPKGQRVCKFYESGHCKRGASCNYLHPHP